MTTSPSPGVPSPSLNNGEFPSSLPRWRQFLSMLNWRRDPDYEQRKLQSEWRMKQIDERTKQIDERTKRLESEILLVKNDSERIRKEAEQIERETEQIERETELLRQENAKQKALSASIRRLCFPPESSSIPQTPTEPDCEPSSP